MNVKKLKYLSTTIFVELRKIKFTLEKDLKLAETALLKLSCGDRETIWPFGATDDNLGDRETVSGHQGAAVVPDSVATHEIKRPETH